MKTFLVKLLLFIVLFFAADFLLGNIIGNLHLNSKNIEINKMNYGFINYENDDILIFGASEVAHSFISNKVVTETGLSSYNFAQDGSGILFQYPLLETVLEKHSPKVIIISSRQIGETGNDYINGLLPYNKNNKHVKQILEDNYSRLWIKRAFQGYIYNSKFIAIFNAKKDNARGYLPLTPKKYGKVKKVDYLELPAGTEHEISIETKSYFSKFLEKAVASGANVYVYVPPALEIVNESYLNTVKSLTEEAGATLMDFSSDHSFLNNPELFNDTVHLNHNGAEILTDKIIEILKKDIGY
jgi:hypothetical protein